MQISYKFASMNLDGLHNVCKEVTNKEYYWFKHAIKNPLFEVEDSYIEQNIYHMKEAINIGINKRFFICPSQKSHYLVKQKIVDYYIKTAVSYGLNFSKLNEKKL